MYSTVASSSLVENSVKKVLFEKGSVFGEFTITEFADPFLQEHILSVSLYDIPTDVKVCLCSAHFSLIFLSVH
jgi:hypothetical protein